MKNNKFKTEIPDFFSDIIYGKISSYQMSEQELRLKCFEVAFYGLDSLAVLPSYLEQARKIISSEKLSLQLTAVSSYPSGTYPPEVKAKEIKKLISRGAEEVFMVLAAGSLRDGNYQQISKEIEILSEASGTKRNALILELSFLEKEEINFIIAEAADQGVDGLMISTSFEPNFEYNNMVNPSFADIKNIKSICKGSLDLIVNAKFFTPKEIFALIRLGLDKIYIEDISMLKKLQGGDFDD